MTGSLPGPAPEDRPHPTGRRNAQGVRIDPVAEAAEPPRRAVISALVSHEPGVLAEVSTLFARRRYNIESLTVGSTTNPDLARITAVCEEPEAGIDQAKKQLGKLEPVVSVRELGGDAVRRELVILKVRGDEPDKVQAITRMYDGRTLDAGPRTVTVEFTGDESTIDDAIDAFRQFGIREIARTGQAALARGEEATVPPAEEPDATARRTAAEAAADAAATAAPAAVAATPVDATPAEATGSGTEAAGSGTGTADDAPATTGDATTTADDETPTDEEKR